jgi:hypothetical protein
MKDSWNLIYRFNPSKLQEEKQVSFEGDFKVFKIRKMMKIIESEMMEPVNSWAVSCRLGLPLDTGSQEEDNTKSIKGITHIITK